MENIGGADPVEGTDVEFDIEQVPKGPSATNVVRAGDTTSHWTVTSV